MNHLRARTTRCLLPLLLLALLVGAAAMGPKPGFSGASTTLFIALDVYVDAGDTPLGAYQIGFEGESKHGDIQLVGVEGGETEAFSQPPYYDPEALASDHIIIGAYSTNPNLPSGRTRVARLHLQIPSGKSPEYTIRLMTAGNADASPIDARCSVQQAEANNTDTTEETTDETGAP